MIEKVINNPVIYHEKYWGVVSSEAKELVKTMLEKDRTKRASIEEVNKSLWINNDMYDAVDK